MKSSTTVWKVPPWAWVPIGLAVTAEGVSNALKAYGIGAELKRWAVTIADHEVSTTGAALVCAAVAISLLQARAVWAAFAPGTPLRQRVITGLAGLLMLAVSTIAMATHLLEAQRAKASVESHEGDSYSTAKAAYDKAEAELKRFADVRTPDEIKASLEAAPVPRSVFLKTKECTDVTLDASMEACRPISALRIELASALRKRELEADVPRLKTALDRLPKPLEPTYWETLAASSWSWLLGLAVVIIATFGPVICARVEAVPPANDNTPRREPAKEPDTAGPKPLRVSKEKAAEKPAGSSRRPEPSTGALMSATRFDQVRAFVESFEDRTGRRPTFTETKLATGLPKATVSVCLGRLNAA